METGKREEPEPGHWERLAASLSFTSTERERFLQAYALFETHMARLASARASLHERLQALTTLQPMALLGRAASGEEQEVLALLEKEVMSEAWAVSAHGAWHAASWWAAVAAPGAGAGDACLLRWPHACRASTLHQAPCS